MDISKAFDPVLQSVWIYKLQQLGIDGSLLDLLFLYLGGRSHIVIINDSCSNACFMNCGIPQGPVFRPLLLLLYVNNIADTTESPISLFADDTALLFSSNCPLHLHQVLTRDLHTIFNWPNLWNVNFNPAMTKVLTISKPHLSHPILTFNSFDLSETDSYKYFGLVLYFIEPYHSNIIFCRWNKIPQIR